MTPIDRPGDLLRSYGTRAKKRFGQHFLTDPAILTKIVEAADFAPGAQVLEIGPGCGTLTWALLEAGAHVTAIELDDDAYEFLEAELAPRYEHLHVVRADATEVDFHELLGEGRWHAVANLPYNVATPILFRLLEVGQSGGGGFERLTLMFQKEVADRITADPGSKRYGALTLNVRLHARARVGFTLKPGSFTPPPAVDSAAVLLEPIIGTAIEHPRHRARFSELVTAAFGQRRKTMRNALRSRWPADLVDTWLEAGGIPPNARAEQLTFDDFVTLAALAQDERAEGEDRE